MVSLAYGLVFVVAGFVLTFGLWRIGATYLILPLVSGFMLLGPALTLGFQAISRDLEGRKRPSFGGALLAWQGNAAAMFNFGMAFTCFFLLWMRLAQLVFALTFPRTALLDPQSLLTTMLFTFDGLTFLALFVALGAVMATLAFAGGAFALPMLLDRNVGVIEAMGTSFTAVILNVPTMIVWAAILVVLTAAGMALFYVGLITTLPLAGYATWHAYRAVIIAEELKLPASP
ncbi:MAG: DUF2189 domain-containing protein [Xanthobacteraceae bacterium]|nr:DUF2189 domain-containing protein [Xanthobacteraceae bacterium]MBV9239972.1 DUF2189 domain-containing protein [Xanthobacteraceae bacterium]MBV9631370.1 DUF2189 domain-containing protein [Xanthobacteraceae bacterium]